MEDSQGPNLVSQEAVEMRFAQTLQRCMAPPEGADGLSLNPVSLSSGILLVERETEIENGTNNPSDRYTTDLLVKALAELGLESNGSVKKTINEMVEKQFVELADGGELLARTPLRAFMKRLNTTFPQMQGLNLIAYLIQTMEEVLSGRKVIDSAVAQLEQTLQLQRSVPISGEETASTPLKEADSPRPKGNRRDARSLKSALSRRLRQRQKRSLSPAQGAKPVTPVKGEKPVDAQELRPVVLSTGGEAAPTEVKEVFSNQRKVPRPDGQYEGVQPFDSDPGQEAQVVSPPSDVRSGHDDVTEEGKSEAVFSREISDEREAQPPENLIPKQPGADEASELNLDEGPDQDLGSAPEVDAGPVGSPPEGSRTQETHPQDTDEQPVMEDAPADAFPGPPRVQDTQPTEAKKRNAMTPPQGKTGPVETVGASPIMTCPVCHSGGIHEQLTEKARTYFTCSNPDCVFVSWGKPNARSCPSCKSSYLIEATGEDGVPLLRCPRATCRYRREMSESTGDHQSQRSTTRGEIPSSRFTPIAQKPMKRAKRVVKRRVVRKKH